jgi:hypothetical protein
MYIRILKVARSSEYFHKAYLPTAQVFNSTSLLAVYCYCCSIVFVRNFITCNRFSKRYVCERQSSA